MEEIYEIEEKVTERNSVKSNSESKFITEETSSQTTNNTGELISKQVIVGRIDEAPEYLRDNEYIQQGYRINCNSAKHLLKSLFILHNESVNIWSHLLGALMVIVLIVYTTIFIKSRNYDFLNSLNLNMTQVNEELGNIVDSVGRLVPNLKNIKSGIDETYEESLNIVQHYTEKILNKTSEYYSVVDEKIGIYDKYVNTKNTLDDIVLSLSRLKDNLGDHMSNYTNIIVDESIHILEKIEDSAVIHFFEDVNVKLGKLTDKISDLLDSSDISWVDIYAAESKVKSNRLTRWPIFVMLSGAIICLSCSAIFHWFSAHSRQLHEILNRLDYAGISILIAGSCYPPYYYFFYCEQILRTSYLTFISSFALSVFFYSLRPSFCKPHNRKLRGTLFLVLGLSTAFPILHLALFGNTVKGFDTHPYLIYWYLGGVSYVTGALIYIFRIPEKYRPGKHCIWGSSHQIFHFFVVMGVIFHYFGSLDSYYYRVDNACPLN